MFLFTYCLAKILHLPNHFFFCFFSICLLFCLFVSLPPSPLVHCPALFLLCPVISFIWKTFCYSRSLAFSLLLPSVEMHHPHSQLNNSPSHHARAAFCCQDPSPPCWSTPAPRFCVFLQQEDAAGSVQAVQSSSAVLSARSCLCTPCSAFPSCCFWLLFQPNQRGQGGNYTFPWVRNAI